MTSKRKSVVLKCLFFVCGACVKIFIVTDAWKPQVNGVVRALTSLTNELAVMGHDVLVIGPDEGRFFTFCLPCYPEIRLEFFARRRLKKILRDFSPDAVHIVTEGPLGWAARNLCLKEGRKFTTAYHTNFPDYLAARVPRFFAPFVAKISFAVLRRFHAPSSAVMVATSSIENKLRAERFDHLVRIPYGVDTELFKPYGKKIKAYENLQRPILLYVGRVAVEKNLRAFLEIQTPGSKVVIGDGPDLTMLRKQYPKAHFLGLMEGDTLARHFAAADLFVFPSKTDTFGLVLLEACAAGLRIAAYRASGPSDLFENKKANFFCTLDDNLQKAIDCALSLLDNPQNPRAFAAGFSWKGCAERFLAHI